jgi:hypothetical protein
MSTVVDFYDAFEYVGYAAYGENRAVYDRMEDCFLYASEMAGVDDIPEFPDPDRYVGIPHKNELDLGRDLVLEFADTRIPDDYGRVRSFFSKAGAYARFKDLLFERGLLKEWYAFEEAAGHAAVERWCADNHIGFAPDPTAHSEEVPVSAESIPIADQAAGDGQVRAFPEFTEKQGQYLAFIDSYMTMFRQAPAESDLQEFFGAAPPTVHQMIIKLEEKGLISRVPRQARSIRLLVDPDELPRLEPRGVVPTCR